MNENIRLSRQQMYENSHASALIQKDCVAVGCQNVMRPEEQRGNFLNDYYRCRVLQPQQVITALQRTGFPNAKVNEKSGVLYPDGHIEFFQ